MFGHHATAAAARLGLRIAVRASHDNGI